ncbi:condensation domain-containing protein [Nonomuraea sp. NPDC049400]|uniref:condensation domain-containing protein n=1 Tax=Nonomuraea sp. NPDC049400 TaxID=3364352 RepID=UPI00378FDA5F
MRKWVERVLGGSPFDNGKAGGADAADHSGWRERVGRLSERQRSLLYARLARYLGQDAVDPTVRVVAYVVEKRAGTLTNGEIRAFAQSRLPAAFVPSRLVRMAALPVLPSGKVDRSMLPPPDVRDLAIETPYEAPRTDTERRLASLWSEVLGLPVVGVHDEFWALGGQSALAARLVARARDAFQIELPVVSLFEEPTIAGLARLIDSAPAAVPVPRAARGRTPLSSAQHRHWFLQTLEPDSAVYNICDAIRIAGPLDTAALGSAIAEIHRRHDILRTRYVSERGLPVQEVLPSDAVPLPLDDLRHLPLRERDEAAATLLARESRRPFDLSRLPLLRARLIRMRADEHVLLLVAHHIVADDFAFAVFHQELSALYAAFATGGPLLPAPPMQYADYAAWEQQAVERDLPEALDYWRRQLASTRRPSRPLTDYSHPPRPARLARTAEFHVTGRTVDLLAAWARGHRTTMFAAVLAAFSRMLGRRTAADDVVVGVPFANRGHRHLDRLMGCFINPAALRVDLAGRPDVHTVLARARDAIDQARLRQHIPFEKVVNALRTDHDAELFQVVLNFMDAANAPELAGCSTSHMDVGATLTAKHDMTLYVRHAPGVLDGHLVCDADLFADQTVTDIVADFTVTLEETAALSSLPRRSAR